MPREKFLQELTGDHHESMIFSRMIWRAALDTHASGSKTVLSTLTEKMRDYFNEILEPHFKAEEEVVALFVRHVGEKDADVVEFFKHHRDLRTLVREGSLESMVAFAAELDLHIRFEEKTLFPRIQESLTDLEKLAAESDLKRAGHALPSRERTADPA